MSYFDGYLAPVPRANKALYENIARISEQVLKENGALQVIDCWLDESGPEAASFHAEGSASGSSANPNFFRAAGARADETVVMAFVEWPDKATRDTGMEKAMKDPRMEFECNPSAFDGDRLVAAGFEPVLSATA